MPESLALDSTSQRLHATAAEIKKQFYTLSKTHHPDHNPNDPEAATRFVKISEAYAVLGSSQKRERYDRDLRRTSAPAHAYRGSHSSTSGPAGGRSASGLSRRRTHFRGPPPSFYRSGGWGTQGRKRQAQANASPSSSETSGTAPGPGTSYPFGGDDEVPHFDREGHYRTQEQQEQRRRRRMAEAEIPSESGRGTLINFLLVTSVLSLAISLPALMSQAVTRRQKEKAAGRANF
ncbi:MAG: hypothetical protein M1817_004038 [Caeruleum heppii]|nr:MAG: hypothetical protein M1817_004038 [Caeruleum heppii]